jgi:hypothetical protein
MRSTVARRPSRRSLDEALEEWVKEGLISDAQSEAIRRRQTATDDHREVVAPGPTRGPSLLVEALGYVGGLVMVIGAGILVGTYWADLSVPARLVLVGATAAALVGAGFAISERLGDAATRLRAVLWAAGVAATGGFMVVLCAEVLDLRDEDQLWLVGAVSAVVAGVLWWLHRTWLQQLALLAAVLLTTVGAALQVAPDDSGWPGAAVWVVSLAWTGLAWAGAIPPRVIGVCFGVAGAVLGAMSIPDDLGVVLGLVTAVGAVALALWERERAWLAVGALAVLYAAPRAASTWFPGRLSAALTFLVTGGLLVGAAVWVARRHARDG